MAAAGAELVRGVDGGETFAATGDELVSALRAEVEAALDVRGAGGATRSEWVTQEEVKDRAHSARHDEAKQHPEAGAHGTAGCIFADVADHEEVEGCEESPTDVEVDAQADGGQMAMLVGKNNPEIVLNEHERERSEDHGPVRNEPCVLVDRDVLRCVCHTYCFQLEIGRLKKRPEVLLHFALRLRSSIIADGRGGKEVAWFRVVGQFEIHRACALGSLSSKLIHA